ncbi:MAG: phytase [Pseudomonadales bacterium]|jgi:3-phytase|nr:phytase [Pseudomonadales bacterium]
MTRITPSRGRAAPARVLALSLALLAPGLAAAAGLRTADGVVRLEAGHWLREDGTVLALEESAARAGLPLPVLADLLPLSGAGPDLLGGVPADGDGVWLLEPGAPALRLALPGPGATHPVDALCGARIDEVLELFTGDGDGRWLHWSVPRHPERGWEPRLVRTLHTGPDSERCAVDPVTGQLWIAEGAAGLWRTGAGAEAPADRTLVHHQADFEPEVLTAVPGGAVWQEEDGTLAGTVALPQASGSLLAAVPPRLAAVDAVPAPRPVEGVPGAEPVRRSWPGVRARLETATVERFGDAADDPAIWIHPRDPARSLVLGTDKQQGLLVFDAAGSRLQSLPVGRLNNVDLRVVDEHGNAVAVATDRTHRALAVFRVADTEPPVSVIGGETALSGLGDPYGVCLYRLPSGVLGVFANDTDGRVEHHRLRIDGERAGLERLAAWRLPSQPEGCVVDEASGTLWIGEEAAGIWRFPLDATGLADGTLAIPAVPEHGLIPDVEGLALLRDGERHWLVASSQGDDSYAVFDVAGEPRHLGNVRVVRDLEAGIDGASETDGLALAPTDLGGAFPGGLLVVQDGRNRMPPEPQNFKFVAWADVLAALEASRHD